jgi:hypothetical protein
VLSSGVLSTYAPNHTVLFDRYFSLLFPCCCSFRSKNPVGSKVDINDVPKSRFVLSIVSVTEHNAAGVKPIDHTFTTTDPRLWRLKMEGEHYTTYLRPVKTSDEDLENFKSWSNDLVNVSKAARRWERGEFGRGVSATS